LSPNLDDLICGEAEEVADMDRIALHDREERFLPAGQPFTVFPADHRLVANIISDIVEVDYAAKRFAGCQEFWNVGTLHEAEPRFRPPEIWRDFVLSPEGIAQEIIRIARAEP